MITAIAIDDEPLALTLIRSFCEDVDFIDLQATFSSTVKAMQFLQENKVDLIFLDIQMPGMNGIEFSKLLPQKAMVIFTTAFSEYAVTGFDLNALDYLLKPFEFERFLQAVSKAKEYHEYLKDPEAFQPFIYVKIDSEVQKINFDIIEYLEGVGNYIKIHLPNNKHVLTRLSMKEMEDKVSRHGFIRVNRSYIVPMKNIISIRRKTINTATAQIPIGTNYIEELRRIFNDDSI